MTAPTPTSDARSQRERMLAGDLYIADDSELARDYQRAMALLERFNATPASDPALRRRILEDLLGGFGAGAVVTKDVPPNSIVVGNPARVVR